MKNPSFNAGDSLDFFSIFVTQLKEQTSAPSSLQLINLQTSPQALFPAWWNSAVTNLPASKGPSNHLRFHHQWATDPRMSRWKHRGNTDSISSDWKWQIRDVIIFFFSQRKKNVMDNDALGGNKILQRFIIFQSRKKGQSGWRSQQCN